MNIQVVQDFGKECIYPEDGWYVSPDGTFAVVADGCSEPYSLPDRPPFMYPDNLSGGQMVSKIAQKVFSEAKKDELLKEVVLKANEEVWSVQQEHRGKSVARNDASTLANASFACLKFDRKSEQVEALWGADCFVLWKTKSGEVSIIGGDNRVADLQREQIYAATADKREYWLKKFPELKRQQDNVLYAVLNGQPNLPNLWHEEAIQEPIELVVLLTDGAWIPMERWDENAAMAEEFVRQLEQNGLSKAFQWVRQTQNEGLTSKRIARPEATALAIFAD